MEITIHIEISPLTGTLKHISVDGEPLAIAEFSDLYGAIVASYNKKQEEKKKS